MELVAQDRKETVGGSCDFWDMETRETLLASNEKRLSVISANRSSFPSDEHTGLFSLLQYLEYANGNTPVPWDQSVARCDITVMSAATNTNYTGRHVDTNVDVVRFEKETHCWLRALMSPSQIYTFHILGMRFPAA